MAGYAHGRLLEEGELRVERLGKNDLETKRTAESDEHSDAGTEDEMEEQEEHPNARFQWTWTELNSR